MLTQQLSEPSGGSGHDAGGSEGQDERRDGASEGAKVICSLVAVPALVKTR